VRAAFNSTAALPFDFFLGVSSLSVENMTT
jgi:hypothetical protein